MNRALKKEIIKDVLNTFGINNNISTFNVLSQDLLIDKKISFMDQDDKKHMSNVYATKININDATLKIMTVNLSDNDNSEYACIVQLDNLHPYALKINFSDPDDDGELCYCFEEHWLEADIYSQANFLSGMEQVFSLFISLQRLDDYDSMYKLLVSFLNEKSES